MAEPDDRLASLLDVAAHEHDEAAARGETGPPEFTENAVARRFASKAEGTLVYNHSSPGWLTWSGDVWSTDRTGTATERTRQFVEAERNRAILPGDLAAMGRVRFISAVEQVSRTDPRLAVDQGLLDRDILMLGTPDGVVDLCTGALRRGLPSELITRQTAVAPGPAGTPAPHWQVFLNQATRGDDELVGFLRRWSGYCLSGDVTEEVLTFLYGDGGNGKGVFVGTITGIMGTYAISQPMEAFSVGARLPAEYYRAQMAGARLVTSSETESGRVWAESQIKELTGNEAPVSARHPYGRPFTYKPQFKLQFVGNFAPSLRSRNPGMERRLRVVPFTHKPPCPDPGLKDRLRAEWPAIFRWMLDGCLEWQRERLGTATVIEQASKKYFVQQDGLGRWLEERCILGIGVSTRPSDLFSDYRAWCQSNGEVALSSSEFTEARDRIEGLTLKTVRGVRWVVGIGFRATQDDRWGE